MKDADINDTLTATTRCLIQADASAAPASPDVESIGSLVIAGQLLVQTSAGLLARIQAIEAAAAQAAKAVLTVSRNGDGPHPASPSAPI